MDINATSEQDVADIIEIRDPAVDVNALMATVRENVARRRAEGAYSEDLDAIAAEVFATVPAAPAGPAQSPLSRSLADANARWIVREMPFRSQTPVLGRAIVAVRSLWNWVSTKWYVRAILTQQVGFNGTTVQVLNELAAEVARQDEEVRRLVKIVERQQAEIDMLKQGAHM